MCIFSTFLGFSNNFQIGLECIREAAGAATTLKIKKPCVLYILQTYLSYYLRLDMALWIGSMLL